MKLFTNDFVKLTKHFSIDVERAKKGVMGYHWHEVVLYFQNLLIPISKANRVLIIKKMDNEIWHFGEACTLCEIKQHFFWHDNTNLVKEFVKACDKCQVVRQIGNLQFSFEGMKSVPIYDL